MHSNYKVEDYFEGFVVGMSKRNLNNGALQGYGELTRAGANTCINQKGMVKNMGS